MARSNFLNIASALQGESFKNRSAQFS